VSHERSDEERRREYIQTTFWKSDELEIFGDDCGGGGSKLNACK
jgi:hypothetical protein